MFYICIIILLQGVFLYHSGHKDKGVLIFLFFLSDGFHLLPPSLMHGAPINKYTDFALLYMFYVWMMQVFQHRIFFTWKFPCYKWIFLLVLYLSFEFLFTILMGREQFFFSMATYRNYLLWLSFGLFGELTSLQIRKIITILFAITLLTTVLFIIQPIVGENLLKAGKIDDTGRLRNIPTLCYFFLVYSTITLIFTKFKNLFVLCVFVVALILTQHRGIMIGYVMTLLLYVLMSRRFGKLMQYGIVALIIALFAGSFLIERFEGNKNDMASNDLKVLWNMDISKAADMGYHRGEGTLTFRIMLLTERLNFLLDHKDYMWTGVGMRHEQSPFTDKNFNFVLGSANMDEDTGEWLPQQLDSADLVWATPLIKFGFIGIAFYIIIVTYIARFFYSKKKLSTFSMSIFLYYVLLIIISFQDDILFRPWTLAFIYIFMELIKKTENETVVNLCNYKKL